MADSGGLFGLRQIRSGLRQVRRQLADGPPRTFASNFRLSPPQTKLDYFYLESACVRGRQKSAAEEVRHGVSATEYPRPSGHFRVRVRLTVSIGVRVTVIVEVGVRVSVRVRVGVRGLGLCLCLGLG